MASPSEKLAESLKTLHTLQQGGKVAIRSVDLPRSHRERLTGNGFLREVIKGWYVPARPDDQRGDSTPWYASYWGFCADYLESRFGDDWCVSPEQSLILHSGDRTVPTQLLVRTRSGSNKPTQLVHGTSIATVRAALPDVAHRRVADGIRVFSPESALVHARPRIFQRDSVIVRAVLAMISDPSRLLELLLEGGHSVIAGRLAGAFRNIGRAREADGILRTMSAAGYDVREVDPFAQPAPVLMRTRAVSPHVTRVRLMWHGMRDRIAHHFPRTPGQVEDVKAYLKRMDEIYVTDAYHSLSIEGYRVSSELIERVRSGDWNPDEVADDREQRDALAARGYFEAFQAVKSSVEAVLTGASPGMVADEHHGVWYQKLFAPSVAAGLVRAADLAGYRGGPVYIRQSRHVPPSHDAVRDLMPALFELLQEESDPATRVVLGHFVFVYIHPYLDGNGRIGRFLMNVMMAAGGYPWTVIPVERRDEYMAALEQASVHSDIEPFVAFLGSLN